MTLKKKSKQFIDDAQALEQLKVDKAQAEKTLHELENDTNIDLDEAADLAVQATRVIETSTFKVKAIEKRQAKLRAEIVDAINDAELAHRTGGKQVETDRRAEAVKRLKSGEFEEFLTTLKGLFGLGDFYTWEAFTKEYLPQHCERPEARKIAVDRGWWIDDPERPGVITEAERAIDFDRDEDRPEHIEHLRKYA